MDLKNILGILVAILLLLFLWTGYKSYSLGGEVEKMAAKNEQLSAQVGDLEALKMNLQTEIDSLSSAYSSLSEENESLATSLKDEKSRSARRNREIKKLKAAQSDLTTKAAADNNNLQSQIANLLAVKSQLEANINNLQSENQSLKDKLGMVEADLGKAKQNNSALEALNASMQGEISKLTLSNFKATAFQVDVEKRKASKVTSKSRWAKRIKSSFDLTNVPEKYQGVRPLYLVITDQTSNPIKLDNPIKATVSVNGQDSQILAAESKEVNIKENQRINFSHELDSKLKAGFYRVIVYTDIGVLGASTIRLR